MTIPDILFFVNQSVSTIEAAAEEVKQLKKRLDEMDVLLKSPGITEMQYSCILGIGLHITVAASAIDERVVAEWLF